MPARPPVAEIGAADLARLTSTAPIAAPRQIATCLDLPGLRFPAIAFGARASWRRFNGCLDRVASARLVIVPTGRVAVEVTDLLGIPESRIRVITPGAPPITAPGPVTHHPPIVLLVANRKPDANAALGVRALALTDPRHEPRAVIVGVDDRRRRERLRRLAGALGASARTTLSRSPVAARLADLRRTATIAPVPSYAAGVSVRVLAALDRDAADETWACNLEASDA